MVLSCGKNFFFDSYLYLPLVTFIYLSPPGLPAGRVHGAVPRAARPGVLTRHDRPEKPVKQVRLGATGCDSRLPLGHFCFLLSQFLFCPAAMSKNAAPGQCQEHKSSAHLSFCPNPSRHRNFTTFLQLVSLPSNEKRIFI